MKHPKKTPLINANTVGEETVSWLIPRPLNIATKYKIVVGLVIISINVEIYMENRVSPLRFAALFAGCFKKVFTPK